MADNENVDPMQQSNSTPEQENVPSFDQVLEDEKVKEPVNEPAAEKPVSNEESLSVDVTNLVTMTHLLGLIGFVGPLIIWLLKRDEHKFVNEQVKEILNYQMSLMIYFLAVFLISRLWMSFGVWVIPILMVAHMIFVIIASVKSGEGKAYRYPIAIRFLK